MVKKFRVEILTTITKFHDILVQQLMTVWCGDVWLTHTGNMLMSVIITGLTCVKKNTAYETSQTEQVYTITFPMDTLEELTVNSLQKLEWL